MRLEHVPISQVCAVPTLTDVRCVQCPSASSPRPSPRACALLRLGRALTHAAACYAAYRLRLCPLARVLLSRRACELPAADQPRPRTRSACWCSIPPRVNSQPRARRGAGDLARTHRGVGGGLDVLARQPRQIDPIATPGFDGAGAWRPPMQHFVLSLQRSCRFIPRWQL